jgi:drug/metabolite transporter (DMT)-like permease
MKGRKMVFSLVLVFICVIFSAMGQILMRTGMAQVGEITSIQQLFNFGTILRIFTNLYVLAGILCFASMIVFWLAAISALKISFAYPLASLVYVITAIAALIFLKEDITLLRWVGIFFVVGGCVLVSIS